MAENQILAPKAIHDDGLSNYCVNGKVIGYILKVYLNYYRSLELSCIEKLALTVDGKAVDSHNITFCINGKRFMISQLKDLFAEYWSLETPAELIVMSPTGLSKGDHEVTFTLILRVPYIIPGHTIDTMWKDFKNQEFWRWDNSGTMTVTVLEK